MDGWKIYHNPRWGSSRKALQLLRDNSIEPQIINYIKTPLSEEDINNISIMLGIEPGDFTRVKESDFIDNGFIKIINDREKIIKAMSKYPKIMQRPIIVHRNKAIIGRPPKNVLQLI